ncbi:AAA family ATPase [Blautia sp. AF17-9LB]
MFCIMNRPTLWVMCGLSGSGKSSVAKEIVKNNPKKEMNNK